MINAMLAGIENLNSHFGWAGGSIKLELARQLLTPSPIHRRPQSKRWGTPRGGVAVVTLGVGHRSVP